MQKNDIYGRHLFGFKYQYKIYTIKAYNEFKAKNELAYMLNKYAKYFKTY